MLTYNPRLKNRPRSLRNSLTDAEQRLWSHCAGNNYQESGFTGKSPSATTLSDFYAPAVRLCIEVDGSHHLDVNQATHDKQRSQYLEQIGLDVLRFDDLQVLPQTESVIEEIYRIVTKKCVDLSHLRGT